jgi:uncharacterized repeat protein (TIGR01451 family)
VVTAAPYQLDWSNVPIGNYQIDATVTDTVGRTAKAAPVNVSVVVPDTRQRVAIIQNFADPEISTMQGWLTDLDLSTRIFNQEGLTFDALKNFDLIIWDDLGQTANGLTANDVSILTGLFAAGKPVYLIGSKLTASAATLPPSVAAGWSALTHLSPAGPPISGDNQVTVQDSLHPVNNGPFGFVGSFTIKTNLEHDVAAGTGEEVVASSDKSAAVIAYEDPTSTTRSAAETFLISNGGGVNATVQREKLFKNAVWWLLHLPGVPPFMNVSLDISPIAPQIKVGQDVTLNVSIRHTGEIPATGLILTVALPPNLSFVSASVDNGTSISEDQNVICFLPNLEKTGTTSATIVVHASTPGPVEIDSAVSENQAEAILDDNYFQTTFEIVK